MSGFNSIPIYSSLKTRFNEAQNVIYQQFTKIFTGGGKLFTGAMLTLIMGVIHLPSSFAQCSPQADFTFTINDCDVEFQPVSSGAGVAHFWTFQTTGVGFVSASDVANPLHTFGSGAGFSNRTVTHSVTVGGVMYTCVKQITVDCTEGCSDKNFGYTVNGCSVTFDAGLLTGQNWDFGDGNTSSQTDPTHTYAAIGDYTVTYSTSGGLVCQKTIRVFCGTIPSCCSGEFTAKLYTECSVLKLELGAECTSGGTHFWSISPNIPGACLTLDNFFQGAPVQGMIRLTNINTCVVSSINITHQYTCPNGTVHTVTKSLNTPVQGIFIGRDGQTTNLSDYACVLPGSAYNGSCVVYSSGIVDIDKDFSFASATVRVQPGLAGFDVKAPFNFTIRQGTVVSGNPDPDCRCLWRGIYVNPDAKLTTGSEASVEDALYAVRAGLSSTLEIRKTHFRKNFIGIRATEGPFVMDFFEENEFDGAGPLYNICSLASMNDIQAVTGSACQIPVPYFNERGFAGIYLRNAGSVNLLPLGYTLQNTFHDLAVGIDAYDTELSINRNCRFTRILPGAYMISNVESFGGVAVRFNDNPAQGVNGIRYRGNGMFASNPSPDFDDCACGFFLASGILATSTSGTRIQITECRMLGQHTGINFSDNCGGVFTGYDKHFFRGIQNNYIEVNPSTQFPDLLPLAGIFLADFTLAQSAPEIARNIIDVNQASSSGCNSSGIRTQGITGDVIEQVNIHRNTVNVNQGSNGIILGNYSGAWVHDNSDAGLAGAGIFINHQCIDDNSDFSTGITVSGSHNNLVGCNDIISTAPNTRDLAVTFHQNGTYTRNNLVNGRYGAIFRLSATGTRFACNTMSNYTENGLRYEAGANTGLQGTPDTTFGNQWINANPALLGAFADMTVNPASSRYFVRTLPGENPSSSPANWFIPFVPNNIPPTCHYDCPITAPLFFADEITAWDDSVASGAAGYVYFPEAARWIDERNLYEKLYRNPALVSGNPVMDTFVSSLQGSAIAGMVEAGESIRDLYAIDTIHKAALESQAEVIDTLLLQKTLLDSLLAQTTDPVEQETGQALRDSLVQELMDAQSASETLALELTQQRLNGIAGTLALMENIAPANVYEANEKEVLRIYLESFVSGLQPSPEMIDTLYAIGSACPYVNGPAVYDARSLYEKYTGISLPDVDCPEVEKRDSKAGVQMTDAGIRIYPNPADQMLSTSIPANAPEGNYSLQLFNTLGEKVSDAAIYPGDNRTPINTLPGGIYLARITRDGLDLYSTAIIIRH